VWKKEIGVFRIYFLYFCNFFYKIQKTKSLCNVHHPHTMGYVCANFRISIFLVSEVACSLLAFWPILAFFLQISPQLKTFSKNLSVRIILVLDATFVSYLTLLDLLGAEISFEEQNNQQPPRQDTHP